LAGALAQSFAPAGQALAAGSPLAPARLRCEYLVNPLGIDEPRPRLSWVVESSERGERQTAYRVLVASDEGLLGKDRGDLWDSGKAGSDQTTGIVYGGKTLASQQRCFWKVKVWDKDGKASAWSEPAEWSLGLLKPGDWKAQYISFRDTTPVHRFAQPLFLPPARQYRKEFAAAKAVRRATIYATALGIYELHVNG
jgi:alpha-L-rhamnosidase